MANIWKIFKNTKITPEKNFKVDSLETYLSALPYTLTIEGAQYIKHDLSITVKINLTQEELNFFKYGNNINYISILNDDTEANNFPVYYFITHKHWISEKAIMLSLVMDTVNTFTEERGSITWSSRTLVNREHKERFIFKPTKFIPMKLKRVTQGSSYYLDRETWSIWGTTKLVSEEGFTFIKFNPTTEEREVAFINEIRFLGAPDFQLRLYVYNGETHTLLETITPASYRLSSTIYIFSTPSPFTMTSPEYAALNFSGYFSGSKYFKNIDLYSEGLTPTLFKQDRYEIAQEGLDWFLIYMNQNEPSESLTNPVNCYLCPSATIEVKAQTKSFEKADLDANLDYVLLHTDSPNATVYITKNNVVTAYNLESDKNRNMHFYIDSNGDLSVLFNTTNDQPNSSYFSYGDFIGVRNVDSIQISEGNNIFEGVLRDGMTLGEVLAFPKTAIGEGATNELNTIENIDRTDAKLIKIIKLPYCPTSFINNSFGGEWEYDAAFKMLKLKNLNTKFENTIISEDNAANIFSVLNAPSFRNVTTESPRSLGYESKLFHSDYYQPKFVYDSFGFVFQLERMDLPEYATPFEFKFVVTTTINSRFMYVFPQYQCGNKDKEDYNNVLPVARNNEVTIFNQQYMNYLRAGFNYDVKSKNRQEAASIIGTSLSLIGAVASFASSSVTGGVGIAAGISLLTGAAAGMVSTVNTIAQSEQNLEAKQVQLRNQSTSVAGSDDVDLMSEYTNNKAKIVLYEVSPKMKKALWDMFHYTGYISGEMKIPNFNSRTWFNFVSCDAQFEEVVNIPDNCLNDLKERYKGGVTVMHYHNKWNWERDYENWETSLNIPNP